MLFVVHISVSADTDKIPIYFFSYRPIRKLNLSAIIGIGRYEKKLIGRPLATVNSRNVEICFKKTRSRIHRHTVPSRLPNIP